MRLHYLQHVAFEDAANIARWAAERGHALSRTLLYADEPLPAHDAYDALAVMGGPMNIYQHDLHPWLAAEKEFLRGAIGRRKFVLGVCLGAQLLADVLGGPVTQNPAKEIGWFPVRKTPQAAQSPLFDVLPPEFTPFHWHGDTFAIPPGALHAASSEGCAQQAFQFTDRVVGLQFHLDYSVSAIERMVAHCGDELHQDHEGPWVETSPERLASAADVQAAEELLYRFLDAWSAATDASHAAGVA